MDGPIKWEYINLRVTQAYGNTAGLCENKSEWERIIFWSVPDRAWKKVCSYWQAPQCRSRKVVDAQYRNVWASPLPHCQHHQFPGTPANIQYCLITSSTSPNSLVSQNPKRIELFFYSMGLSSRVSPLRFSIGCFAYSINNFFPLVMHAQRYCLSLNEKQLISVHWGPNQYRMPRDAKMSLASIEPIYNVLHSNPHTNSKDALKTYQT